MAQLIVGDDENDLAQRAADRLTELIEHAVSANGRAIVSLTGGTTPRRLYGNLADATQPWRDRIPWSQVHLFWGDERHVPPDHPDSNYGMAKAALLDHVPIPPDHVHRMRGELPDAREGARVYSDTLEAVASAFPPPPRLRRDLAEALRAKAGRRKPLFDLMLLGLGQDAHIASIFPGSEILEPREHRFSTGRRVAAVRTPRGDGWRITLTPDAILDAEAIVLLVAGANKAAAVKAALHDPLDLMRFPAQLLRAADRRVEWFLDRAAAGEMRSG